MTMAQTMAATKAAARAEALRRRAEIRGAGPGMAPDILATDVLRDVLRAHAGLVLAGYMPMRGEIDPRPAMAAHAGPVAVPVVTGPAQPLAFRAWHPDAAMVPGAFGALIPREGAWLVPSVLIVPLLAFDAAGYRLGYGGGFYDRTLEGLRGAGDVLAIGLAYAAQRVASVPRQQTDQPLDLIVTETGVLTPG